MVSNFKFVYAVPPESAGLIRISAGSFIGSTGLIPQGSVGVPYCIMMQVFLRRVYTYQRKVNCILRRFHSTG